MTKLVIYPSFLCPFSCAFCATKNLNSLDEKLNLEVLDNILKIHSDKIDEIIISGGEPMSLDSKYFFQLIDLIRLSYRKKITVESYPYTMDNYRDDIDWNFSYDFMIRPRAMETWNNLLNIKKPFKLTVTISPYMFKLFPNAILHKLSYLDNIKEVEFIPYYKNECSEFDITKNDSLTKFNQLILSTKLNLKYKLINKEKLINRMIGEEEYCDTCLLPDGSFMYKQFDKNGILRFMPFENGIEPFDKIKLNTPSEVDLYNNDIIEWAKNNDII